MAEPEEEHEMLWMDEVSEAAPVPEPGPSVPADVRVAQLAAELEASRKEMADLRRELAAKVANPAHLLDGLHSRPCTS
jgi:hypothetical protein